MKFQKVLQTIGNKSKEMRDALALRVLLWLEKEPNDERIGVEPELSRATAASDGASSEHVQPISTRDCVAPLTSSGQD